MSPGKGRAYSPYSFSRMVHLKIVFFAGKNGYFLEFGKINISMIFSGEPFFQLCVKVKDEIQKQIINFQERPGKIFDDPAVLI